MPASFAGAQAHGIYRLKVGAFEVTVLSDGNLPFQRLLTCSPVTRPRRRISGGKRRSGGR